MSNDLVVDDKRHSLQATSPMGLLQLAIEREGSIDVIERLAKLQVEFMEREARIAYAQAFAEFKENLPKIIKTKQVVYEGKNGKQDTSYYHVELDKACDLLVPALLKVGLTHRWSSSSLPNGGIVVTCYLKHRMGYEEAGASLPGAPDASGGKNAIQAIGSTLTYLQRYTLLGTCGIAPKGMDDDARGASEEQEAMDPDKAKELASLMEMTANKDDLRDAYYKAMEACGVDPKDLERADWQEKAKYKKEALAFVELKNKMYKEVGKRK